MPRTATDPAAPAGQAPVVAVIGGGPAGLMAAEVLSQHGIAVDVYDAMPSVGRKFLLAGKGGMNITHAEASEQFRTRYGQRQQEISRLLDSFDADALRTWIHELGIDTFVGSSGRVFPTDMKAAPLLRAWLHRLREAGVRFHMRHRWRGWNANGAVQFDTPDGPLVRQPQALLLALGGGSWARLGSDGRWTTLLAARGVPVAPLRPANCGFELAWSEHFSSRFAGQPVKSVSARTEDSEARRGEFVITAGGIEGSLIYALSAPLRDAIDADGKALLYLDLLPDWSLERAQQELSHPRGSRSMSSHLQSRLKLTGVKAGLLRECTDADTFRDNAALTRAIKALPLTLNAARPIDEAISSAGGVPFEALTADLMLQQLPGVFCAGEMLDWEAPTGGYLLTACFASGRTAASGVLQWLATNKESAP